MSSRIEHYVPLVDWCRWKLFQLFLEGNTKFDEACSRLDWDRRKASDIFMARRDPSLRDCAEWAFSYDRRVDFKLERGEGECQRRRKSRE
jgi:hypothetical protein